MNSKMTRKIEMQICLGSSCFSRGNKDVVMFIKDYLSINHLEDKVIFAAPVAWVIAATVQTS